MTAQLLAQLRDPSPRVRVDAATQLRFVHLKDPAFLVAMLDLCADEQVVAEVETADPFASFFAEAPVKEARTVGDQVVERLDRAGLPRDAWETLRDAMERHPSCRRLYEAAARWAAETRWTDTVAAWECLVPPLQAADVPLLALVARASDAGREVLIRRALDPWNPRTLQELLNHAESQPRTVEVLEQRIADGTVAPTEQEALLLLGLLSGWESPAAPRLAALLEPGFPWAVAYRSLADAEAIPGLLAWLAVPRPAPPDLGWRLVEVANQRPRIEGWPMTAWVRRFELPAETFDAWGCDADALALLQDRVRKGFAGGDRVEAWNATAVLCAEGAHGEVIADIDAAAASDLPWDGDFLARLVVAHPAIPSFAAAIAAGVARWSDVGPALQIADELDDERLRAVLPAVLEQVEASPTVERPAGAGLVRIAREGIDEGVLLRLATRLGDPVLVDRARALEPLVRAKE